MKELDLRRLEFYKHLYDKEHDRSKFYDSLTRFPTTIIMAFIGAGLYIFNNYFENGIKYPDTTIDWIFTVTFILFAISTLIAIFFLGITFHGFTRKYDYLPHTSALREHEIQLYKHHYKFSEKSNYKDKREEATSLTYSNFTKNLENYFIDITDSNQRINDKRADNYFMTRTFLFIDLVLLIILGIIHFII